MFHMVSMMLPSWRQLIALLIGYVKDAMINTILLSILGWGFEFTALSVCACYTVHFMIFCTNGGILIRLRIRRIYGSSNQKVSDFN